MTEVPLKEPLGRGRSQRGVLFIFCIVRRNRSWIDADTPTTVRVQALVLSVKPPLSSEYRGTSLIS